MEWPRMSTAYGHQKEAGPTDPVLLLPADYCQLELPFHVQRTRTESVWKSDMWFGDKALVLKATVADVIHYCQLPKELGFQGRVPTENQNLVPCARAVV